MDRPKQVAWFEWIMFGTLALGAITSWLRWPELVAQAQGNTAFVLFTQIVTFVLLSALYLWVSRGRNNIVKWILIALFVLGLPFTLWVQFAGGVSFGWTFVIQTLAQLVAYALIFTREARAWFRGEQQYDGVFD